MPLTRRFFFIGVTTGHSSIRAIFPRWCETLGLDAELVGIDLPLDTPKERYRELLIQIQRDDQAAGALVTSHKLNVIQAGRDLFSSLDSYAERLQEVACIVRRPNGALEGSAKDPITSMQALGHIVDDEYWAQTGAHVLCPGMGGSGQAFAMGLLERLEPKHQPQHITLVARNERRIEQAREALSPYLNGDRLKLVMASTPESVNALLESLPPSSLVANATGMGKDTPGSPLSDVALFPVNGIAWDFNYRGELLFLQQAERQKAARNLTVEDGWIYFLYGWTQVMAEVFGFPLDEPTFRRLAEIAEPYRAR